MRSIRYKGIDIRIWEQSIAIGHGKTLWFKRPVEADDIAAMKSIIDAGRRSLAREIKVAQNQVTQLIESNQ